MFYILCTFTIGTLVTLNILISETPDRAVPRVINIYSEFSKDASYLSSLFISFIHSSYFCINIFWRWLVKLLFTFCLSQDLGLCQMSPIPILYKKVNILEPLMIFFFHGIDNREGVIIGKRPKCTICRKHVWTYTKISYYYNISYSFLVHILFTKNVKE